VPANKRLLSPTASAPSPDASLSAGLDFFFHMFFLVKYSKSLEEGSFRNRSADFFWMLLFGAAILVATAPWVNIQFLGSSLTFMMVRCRCCQRRRPQPMCSAAMRLHHAISGPSPRSSSWAAQPWPAGLPVKRRCTFGGGGTNT
jgi:hypothetical protein